MKNPKKWLGGLALALAAAVAWGAEDENTDVRYREAVESAVSAVGPALADAPFGDPGTVAILPIHGDQDAWVSGLLKIALTQAGKACVQLEGDPMWDELGKQLVWDERSEDILDPATVDLISRKTLQSAKILLTGRVRQTTNRKGRTGAELTLHATEVATSRHIWGGVFRNGDGPNEGPNGPSLIVTEAVVPLNAELKVTAGKGSEIEADRIETYARGRLADQGYRVNSGKAADLVLTMETACEPYDQIGNYWIFEGSLKATLAVRGGEAHELGAKGTTVRGVRGLGEAQAHRNLADEMEAELGSWLKRTLETEALDFRSARLSLSLDGPIQLAEDYKAIDDIQKALAELPGVRSARVETQNNAKGTVEFVVVYEPAQTPAGVWNALWAAHPELLEHLK